MVGEVRASGEDGLQGGRVRDDDKLQLILIPAMFVHIYRVDWVGLTWILSLPLSAPILPVQIEIWQKLLGS